MINKEKLSIIEDNWKLAKILEDSCNMCINAGICNGLAEASKCIAGIKTWLESDGSKTYKSDFATVEATNCGDYYIIHNEFGDKKVDKELFEFLFRSERDD